MDSQATDEAKLQSSLLAAYALDEIKQAAQTKTSRRVADGGKVSKSSKIGELSFGFASQKFSGGGTTQFNTRNDPPGNRTGIGAGIEFGSAKYPQFPRWSGPMPKGPGSRGWFIYPTLRRIQPALIDKWEAAFTRILKEWS